MNLLLITYVGISAITSLVSVALYGFDKHRARSGGRRIPEKTLHLVALAGGWPGAWIGQRIFRHKTQKMRFLVIFWMIVVLHGTLLLAAFARAAYSGTSQHPVV